MTAPSAQDWLRLLVLVVLWGSAFALVKVGVSGAPPDLLVASRVWIAAALMWAWLRVSGHRLPPLTPRPDRLWLWFAALGFSGTVAPFLLVSVGQTRAPSALAGVLMAMVPILTALFAHIAVPAERLTPRRWAGFLVGFAGVAYLIGPDIFSQAAGAPLWAQALILLAAACYALNAVMATRSPPAPPLVTAAGMVIAAAVMLTPLGLAAALRSGPPTAASLAAIFALGIGATAIAAIVMMQIVRSAGPGFLSLVNYIVPIFALALGWTLGEALTERVFLALPAILLGVLLVARERR
ncbi:MAG: EamA family transporter [Caulobacterales bacterium]|nr:EamA family transporter [Caulobacterales bacterium]